VAFLADLLFKAMEIGGLRCRSAMTIHCHGDADFGKDAAQFPVQRLELALIPFALGGHSNA
jgi:hypothetical protein